MVKRLLGWIDGHTFLTVFTLLFVLTAGSLIFRDQLTAATSSYNEQLRIAQYLARGTGFVCPVGPERQDPSSWYSPGFIGIMAGVLAVFGESSSTSLAIIRLLNAFVLSIGLAIYFQLAKRMFGYKVAGLTLLLWVIHPGLLARADQIWDTTWSSFTGAVLLYIFCFWRLERPFSKLLSGMIAGGAALINPVFTLCYPVWVIFAWLRNKSSGVNVVAFLGHAALILFGFLLVILPWTVRNYLTFGDVFYLRGNLPLEIWVGNAPWAEGDMSSVDGRRIHPVFDETESARMVQLGEYGYFQACRADVAQWWRDNPQRFFRLAFRRFRFFWLGPLNGGQNLLYRIKLWFPVWAVGIFAWIGFVVIMVKHRHARILASTLLVFPLIYYATLWLPRYRLPIEPLLIIITAVVFVEAFHYIRGKFAKSESR